MRRVVAKILRRASHGDRALYKDLKQDWRRIPRKDRSKIRLQFKAELTSQEDL